MEPTEDATCVIEQRGDGFVVYVNTDGERWRIDGVCNQCGSCEMPDAEYIEWRGERGTPGAAWDTRVDPPGAPGRADVPVRPEGPPTWPGCSLSGEYLR